MDEDELQQQEVELREKPKTAREIAMEQVVASRRATVRAEMGIDPGTDDDEEGEGGDAPAPEVQPKREQPSPSDDDDHTDDLQKSIQARQEDEQEHVLDDLDATKVKIKVDGVERMVSVAELVRTAQKNEAADKRLAEATRLLQEAQQRAATPPKETQAPEQQKPDAVKKPVQDPKQKTKEFLDALFQGDEDKAQEILADLVERPSHTETAPELVAVDPDEIATRVEASLERRSALKQFAAAYPEILKDADLAALADMKLARRLEAGDGFSDAIMGIGEELYQKAGLKKPAAAAPATPTATPPSNDRMERKVAANPVRGRNVSAAPSMEEPTTPTSVISEMQAQRARGQWDPKKVQRR